MKPYYEDANAGITIYHGDCRDVLPTIKADVLVTDPPYGIAYKSHASRGRFAKANVYGEITGDDRPFDPSALLALELPTVLFGGNHYASKLPDSPSWFVWDKRVLEGVGVNDSADCEMAWTNLGGPARVFRHVWNGMWRDSERGESYHPTQKPVALMKWVLMKCPPGIVFDPYMGSGTTLLAAKLEGRRAVGIEIEERYCEIAARRLAQEVLPFVRQPAPVVEKPPELFA